jgi:hypothetical protein
MVSNHSRVEEKEMLLSPNKWPHMWLPLKRIVDGHLQIAVLGTATTDPKSPLQVHINSNLWGHADSGKEVEVRHYTDADAVLDDGWRVD